MSLKKLKVSGFKSFAKRTEINFSAGINAIVGPNGCGKSNIVDAFLWALGEQSAKTLRGAKMHDVIFAGSQSQKAVNVAEVTITFDNRERFLPIGYEEVEVTRRLHRDESSDYILNKCVARLKDVQELFAHTGLANETFAVIGQGRIEKIISQSAQERRTMFEEVSGILHFLVKRKESMQKLERTQVNMARAQDIAKEVVIQKITLEKQAEEAKKFQRDRTRLIYLEEQLAKMLLSQSEKKYDHVVQEIVRISHEKEQELAKEQSMLSSLSEKKELFKKNRIELATNSDRLNKLTNTQSLSKKEISFAQEQKNSHQQKISLQQKELTAASDTLVSCKGKKERAERDVKELSEHLRKFQGEYESIEQAFSDVHRKQEVHARDLKKLQLEKGSLDQKIQVLELELKKGELAEEVALEKVKGRAELIESQQLKVKTLIAEIEVKRALQSEKVQAVQQKKELIGHCVLKLQQIEKEEKLLIKKQEDLKRELFENEAKVKVLLRAISDMEGFSQGAKTIIAEAKKATSPLFGKVSLLVDYLDSSLDASNIAMIYDGTLVVKSEEDLHFCLQHSALKKQEVSFLCLEFLDIVDPLAYLSRAIQTAKSVGEAKVRKGPTVVTSEYYIDALGVIFVGKSKEQNPLQRKREVKQLEEKISQLQQESAEFEQKRSQFEQQKAEILQARSALDEEMRRLDYGVVSTTFELQELEKQKGHSEKEIEKQKQECIHYDQLLANLKVKAGDLLEKLKSATADRVQNEALYKKEQALGDEHKTEYAALQEIRKVKGQLYQEAKTSFQKAEHLLQLIAMEEKEAHRRSELFARELTSSKEALDIAVEKEKKAKSVLADAESEFAALGFVVEKMDREHAALELEVVAIEAELVSKQKIREKLSSALASFEVERSHLSTECNRYRDQLQQKEVTLEIDMPATQIEEQIKRLKNAIDKNRQVNLMAIDELEAVVERHALIQEQLADLHAAKDELLKVIQELEKESRKSFKETFEAIRTSFKKHFQTLFNGGDADLILTASDDALDAGVEILAKPPGKEMRSMQLMSGGEKSLTALALLFGCFEIRPSPFCILDEVDAALDEANVERFATLLKSFAGTLQFLVITHNKRTMAVADCLIGVSMQEKGVSQIISLDFRRLETPVAVS